MGLVSRQWDVVGQSCVLCDHRIYNDWASRSALSWQCTCPFYSSCAGFYFWQRITSPRSVTPLQPRFGFLWLLAFPKAKIAVESEEICECDGHTVHRVSQWHVTADWLPHRTVTVHRCIVKSFLTDCQVTPRPCERFSRYSKWTDTFWTAVIYIHSCVCQGIKIKIQDMFKKLKSTICLQ
jgi:hypothetical protein